jgi:hypothetical protein
MKPNSFYSILKRFSKEALKFLGNVFSNTVAVLITKSHPKPPLFIKFEK